jgi:hypothetical protein
VDSSRPPALGRQLQPYEIDVVERACQMTLAGEAPYVPPRFKRRAAARMVKCGLLEPRDGGAFRPTVAGLAWFRAEEERKAALRRQWERRS